MILTAEEYAKCFIDFDADIPDGCSIEIWTATSDSIESAPEYAGPYTDPLGKVQSPPKQYMALRVKLNRGDDVYKSPVIRKIRWERNGQTFIYMMPTGNVGPPGGLTLGRDYGISYQLLFRPKQAVWTEPFVIIDHSVRVRLWKDGIKGNLVSGFDEIKPNLDENEIVEGMVEETTFDGEVVEVLATVQNEDETQGKEEAKTIVESVVGMLALSFGEQILGEKLSEEYFFSSPGGEEGEIPIPFKYQRELIVNEPLVNVANVALGNLKESPIFASVSAALRWYIKGLESTSPIDAFISYFVGLETLASGHFANTDPVPVRKEYSQLEKYFVIAQPPIDHRLRDIALSRLSDFPLTAKFRTYWESRFRKETSESREFGRLNRLRSQLLHGKMQGISPTDVSAAKSLLEKALAHELNVSSMIDDRHTGPNVLHATLRYANVQRLPDSPTE